MDIHINRNHSSPIYQQIYNRIREMIINRELHQGYKLPSQRKLSEELGVHRNTIIRAYNMLVEEGYVCVSNQKPLGYVVKNLGSEVTNKKVFSPLDQTLRYQFSACERKFLELFQESSKEGFISFAGIYIDPKKDPCRGLNKLLENVSIGDLFNKENQGTITEIKGNICKILKNENIYVSEKNVQLVSETNQALNYLTSLYLSPGDTILVEEPITPDNASLFRNKGINTIMVPMEKDGVSLTSLSNLIKKFKPKFFYTMPNYHNPTGATMSIEKRKKLVHIASKVGMFLIEEDSQRDFRYTKYRLPSLYSLAPNRVLYIDSFTLTFPYGIKTGYILGPENVVKTLGNIVTCEETFLNNLGQNIFNIFFDSGLYYEHLNYLKNHYKHKRDLMCSELDKIKGKGINYWLPDGGVLLWCSLDKGIDEKKVFSKARDRNILVMPGYLFYPYGYSGGGHIRLSFSNVTDKEIIKGISLLGESISESQI